MGSVGLENLLQLSMGLSAMSIGSTTIERAVQKRLVVCRLTSVDAYLDRVRGSATELQALIEAVVVPETWFFRDRQAFTSLARFALAWLPLHEHGVLSILSLPCSTGEEPYSIAMTLLDAHVPSHRFHIDAVDISTPNLLGARRGIYRQNSFRDQDLAFRERHFDFTPEGYRLRDPVRGQVRFQQGNLFDPDFLPGTAIYEVIFCRNVLIYFDRGAQERALAVLNRLLRAEGMLFVAPAETALPASQGMVPTNEPLAFAFRKASRSLTVAQPRARVTATPQTVPAAGALKIRPPCRVPSVSISSKATALPPLARPATQDLLDATRLADQGHFAEAASCCEEHLRRCGPSATAFYLIGLVRDATGNHLEAGTYYRKALYLDPNHHDTQVQLALLMEKQGDSAGAQVLRNRTRRLEQHRKAPHE